MKALKFLFFFLPFLPLCLLPLTSSAEEKRQQSATEPVPLVYSASIDNDRQVIIVDKSSQTLRLFRSPRAHTSTGFADASSPLELQALYPVILGSKQGDKRTRGDLRTPEGLYHIKRWLPDQRLPARYGIGAFTLDYPNYLDRLHGKTGNGIWIHGIDPHQDKFDTKGCVALSNENLQLLKTVVSADTPVLITPKLAWGTETDRQKKFHQWRDRTIQWISAWEKGDLDAFSSAYGKDFPRRRGFLANKKNVWRIYPIRSLALGPIEIFFENGHEAVVRFSHMYIADNLKEWGERILYWQKQSDGTFAISAQKWQNKGDVISNLFADTPLDVNTTDTFLVEMWQKINSIVANGAASDLAPLLHPDYRARQSRWAPPLAMVAEIAAKSGHSVDLSSPVGGTVDGLTYLLSFRIAVQSPHGKTRHGKKILVLRKHDDVFRIFRDFYYPE